MLAIYTGNLLTPEVNLRECISYMSLPSANKAAHSSFETQRRHHQKFETGVSVAPKMDMCPTKILKKKEGSLLIVYFIKRRVTFNSLFYLCMFQMEFFLSRSISIVFSWISIR